MMRIHHLNCISSCPLGGRLMDGRTPGVLARGALCCHCLLVETAASLVLVDTGFGLRDVADPRSRLSAFFLRMNAPDFREDLTRYQVEHITGVTSGTAYSPPSCQAMQTFGICYDPDDTCRSRKKDGSARVTHPLNYYRFKVWLKTRPPLGAPPPAQADSNAGGPA